MIILTNAGYRQIEKRLRLTIRKPSIVSDPAIRDQIEAVIQKSVVLPLGSNRRPKSSASNPVPESPAVWVIGAFGSVWADTMIDGKVYRIAFTPDNTYEVMS